jgi:hypothetical protein
MGNEPESSATKKVKDARRRSIDNLQRLYTVVVSLALTESLKKIMATGVIMQTPAGVIMQIPSAVSIQMPVGKVLMFLSLLFTTIPFYHGANRYLDMAYVTGERETNSRALMVDFVMLFVQGLSLFIAAMLIGNEEYFYTTLSGILILDVIWVGITKLSELNPSKDKSHYIEWATINCVAAVLILASVWSKMWKTEFAMQIALTATCLLRSIVDYIRAWPFYYPPDPAATTATGNQT